MNNQARVKTVTAVFQKIQPVIDLVARHAETKREPEPEAKTETPPSSEETQSFVDDTLQVEDAGDVTESPFIYNASASLHKLFSSQFFCIWNTPGSF